MKKKPELLVPAGNYAKFEAAVRYGADAVYLSGRRFGMRAAADNFSLEEMERAVGAAHAAGVRVYVTVNTMPRSDEYPALGDYLEELDRIGADALITPISAFLRSPASVQSTPNITFRHRRCGQLCRLQ